MYLTEEEQNFIYQLYLDYWIKFRREIKEKDYKMISHLHELGLVRSVKMCHSNKQQVIISDDGLVIGSILCQLRNNWKYVKKFAIGYW